MKGILQVIGLSPENIVLLVMSSNYPELGQLILSFYIIFLESILNQVLVLFQVPILHSIYIKRNFIYGVIFTNSELVKSS